MTNLRDHAKGKPCMVRLACCNFNPETTVLAHLRMMGISGMGLKAPDVLGAWCCSACHEYIDTHREDYRARLWFLEGIARTINALVKENVLNW